MSTTTISQEQRELIDADLAALKMGSKVFTTLSVGQRATLLKQVRAAVASQAEAWAKAANVTKRVDANSPLRGEEWLTGPYTTLMGLDALHRTLQKIAGGTSPLDGVKTSVAPGGQIAVHAFPSSGFESLLLNGYTGQVWLTPGTTLDQARAGAGLAQLDPTTSGGIGLVLGAGNITSIPVLDVIYELFAHNRVALLKLNPTQDDLVPIFTRALKPLIEPGFLRIVTGAGDVGAYLTAHEAFSHVHITGSAQTFDAIVWGTGSEAQERRTAATPRLTKPITGELGGVAPIILVPGHWSQADLDYQAEHVVTMRMVNSGHNCIAGQVVVVSDAWAQKDDFLSALRRAYAKAPQRPVWYPHSEDKLASAHESYPKAEQYGQRLLVELADGDDASALEHTEYFSPVLGVISLPGTGQNFLDAAVAYANDSLNGTLGANVIIDPVTEASLGDGFGRAINNLRYGNIAINAWTGFTFTAGTMSWGAYPGHTLEDVCSGIGVVHNALLLDAVERSVMRGPFRPFPRSFGRGVFSILPKPPWFVTSRTAGTVAAGLTKYLVNGNIFGLLKTLGAALRS